jgi:hypothetical protein
MVLQIGVGTRVLQSNLIVGLGSIIFPQLGTNDLPANFMQGLMSPGIADKACSLGPSESTTV